MYGIAGTTTFRLNSKAITKNFKTKETWGGNLQNIEKEARGIYVADEGKTLVQPDQSGAEAKIVAYCCEPGCNFRKLFIHGVKPHIFVALHKFAPIWQTKINEFAGDIKLDIRELTNAAIEDLKNHPFWKELSNLIASSDDWPAQERYYFIAKQMCHSLNYGAKAYAFRMNTLEKSKGMIALTKQQAEEYIDFYNGLFPEISRWHTRVAEQVRATRILYNLQGFPIYFSPEIDDNSLKEAYARVPQSTVGTITNIAFTKMQQYIEDTGIDWDMLQNNHDSFMVQCPDDDVEMCCKISKSFMEQELTSPFGETFKMGSGVSIGKNWGPRKEYKNINGEVVIKNSEGMHEIKL